jgi:hypothetical protein
MTTTISGSNGIVFPDATSMQTGQQAVKAWVNFNGTGTVAIKESYNVSSITDNGTGDYTVNFTTPLVDGNYALVGTTGNNTTSMHVVMQPVTLQSPSTTAVRIQTPSADGTLITNPPSVNVAIFR